MENSNGPKTMDFLGAGKRRVLPMREQLNTTPDDQKGEVPPGADSWHQKRTTKRLSQKGEGGVTSKWVDQRDLLEVG